MSKVIKATVTSNSTEDSYCRVKLSSYGIWKETGLVSSVGGIPLKKGDIVYVEVSEGYENPMILGRSMDKRNQFKGTIPIGGSLLFESCTGDAWTIANVKDNILNIVNSDGSKFVIDKGTILFNGGENGGLINIVDLLKKINNAEEKINDIITKYNNMILPVSSGGTAGPPTVPIGGSLIPTQREEIEDIKVKH